MSKIADLLYCISFHAGLAAVYVLMAMLLICAVLCAVTIWRELSRW